jgi:hypothetical protein
VDYVQVMNNPVPQQQPTVIINQYFTPDAAKPVVREYKDGELSEPASPLRSYQAPIPSQPHVEAKPTVYLIAYKNQSIYPAVGYWLEGDTLHYITTQGAHNRASLDLIDQAFSEQLNRERNIDFKLTAP